MVSKISMDDEKEIKEILMGELGAIHEQQGYIVISCPVRHEPRDVIPYYLMRNCTIADQKVVVLEEATIQDAKAQWDILEADTSEYQKFLLSHPYHYRCIAE